MIVKEDLKMKEKYSGVIPAFYACYDEKGNVDEKRCEALCEYFIEKGVKGLYVGGSSGECIYQTVEDRKKTLEAVMRAGKGKLTVIAHVACNNTEQSMELARHAESLGVDAIASIPPIYFRLPEHAIAKYWNDISSAAPNTPFIIYNIPQLAGVSLTKSLLKEMLKNKNVIGVKNSSMPTQDIEEDKILAGDDFVVFNGPDEQLVSGLAMGADGCIGGTYGVMPELYLKIFDLCKNNRYDEALPIQYKCTEIINKMCSGKGNMYGFIKEIIKRRENIDCGGVRSPLYNLVEEDYPIVEECVSMIDETIKKYCQ